MLSISAQTELHSLQQEATAISNQPKISKADELRFNNLMSKISLIKSGALSDEVRRSQADGLAKEFGFSAERPSEAQNTRSLALESLRAYMLHGEHRIYSPMSTTVGSNGGYLLPSEFMKELFTGIAQYDPLMDRNNVRLIETDNGRTLSVPGIDLSTISAAIVAQNVDAAPVANPTVSNNSFTGYTYRTNPIAVTLELEMDSFELASEILKQAFAVGLARGIGADLIGGSGTGAPEGLLTAAADSTVVTAVSGLIDETSLIQTFFSLNRAYRVSPKCAWVMSDSTYEQVRLLKDSNGRPLLNMRDDNETLMGKRVLVSPSVPSGAGGKIIFGDLSQFVVKVSRGVEIKRSFEAINYAERGIALYTAWLRVDSGLIAPGGSVQPAVYATLHS